MSVLHIFIIIFLFILLLLSAIFSSAEIAYASVNPFKIEEMKKKGYKSAKLIQKHYKSFGWTLATILIANNLVNILASSLITFLISAKASSSISSALISTAILTPIIVIFGEIIPKLFAKKYSYSYLKSLCYFLEVCNWIFAPFTYFLSKITFSTAITNTENQIKNIIDLANEENVIEKREASLVKNALDLDETYVKEVYIKNKNIVFIDSEKLIKEAKDLFKKTKFSRLPVWSGKIKDFIGIIHVRDIIFYQESDSVKKCLIQIPFINQNVLLIKALDTLRATKKHMAFVKTIKNGKVKGLVTMEDVLEELVGEIYDEHDEIDNIHQIELHKYIIKGSLKMKFLNQKFTNKFQGNDEQSLKQWIQKKINRNIKKNLVYTYNKKYVFKIISNKNNEETKIELKIK